MTKTLMNIGLRLRAMSSLVGLAASLIAVVPVAQAQSAADPGADVPYHANFNVTADPALVARLPADIRRQGSIVIGTNPNTPPTIFYGDDNRTLNGREVDIMTAVAQRLGLTPHWRTLGSFDNFIPGLATGRYQTALANIAATPERLKVVDMVSYFVSNRFGLISKGQPGVAASAPATDFLALCGQTVGAGTGTGNVAQLHRVSAQCVAQGKAPITIPEFPSRPAGVQAVVSGRIPSFLGPYEGIRYTAAASKGALVLSGEFDVKLHYINIALKKGSPLTEPVREAVNSLIADGTYGKILAHWDIAYGAVRESKSNQAILDSGEK